MVYGVTACTAGLSERRRRKRNGNTKRRTRDKRLAAHRDLDEVARPVRTNEQRLVYRYRAPEHRPADHDPDTPYFVDAVDGEVDRGQVRLPDLNKAGHAKLRRDGGKERGSRGWLRIRNKTLKWKQLPES